MGALNRPDARRAAALIATLVVCSLLYLSSTRLARVVKINLTDSMPLGVYLVHSASVKPGDIVVACPPPVAARLGLTNGYLIRGSCAIGVAPLLKYVVGTGGNPIRVTSAGITVNGHTLSNSAAHRRDIHGRRIPRFGDGVYHLRQNEVWLYSPAPWSWDSRYFGPVSRSDIIGIAAPIVVMPEQRQHDDRRDSRASLERFANSREE